MICGVWVTKSLMENAVQQLQQQMQALVGELQALKALRGRAARVEDPTPLEVDVEVEDDEAEMEDDTKFLDKEALEWTDVLQGRAVAPKSEPAVQMAQLLSSPPPLSLLKHRDGEFARFSFLPVTPPPRKNKVDYHLYQAQQKLEVLMHILVGIVDGGDKKDLCRVGALARSSWQDMQEQRRSLLAGRNRNQLARRVDDDSHRLLTHEEEEKISKANRPKAKARNFWGENDRGYSQQRYSQHRPRSLSRGRGKGKGKGRGKGKME